MDLANALKGMFYAENQLRSKEGMNNPTFQSEQMMRLSQYTGSVEEHLAGLERDFEIRTSRELKTRLLDTKPPMKVTQAEREVDILLAEEKAQIKYLTRLVASAWKQAGIIQSRINHLTQSAKTNNY